MIERKIRVTIEDGEGSGIERKFEIRFRVEEAKRRWVYGVNQLSPFKADCSSNKNGVDQGGESLDLDLDFLAVKTYPSISS